MKICFIAGRNIGDAVILSRFIKLLSSCGNFNIFILATQKNGEVFESIPNVSVFKSYFPIADISFFYNPFKICNLIYNIIILRRKKIDIGVDIVGDCREIALSKLINPTRHLSPKWPNTHPFRKIIKTTNIFECHYISVPDDFVNVYESTDLMEKATDKVRLLTEECDSLQGFIFNFGL
jgi:ADP-heptose:LPS heptosyltransferase